MNEVNDCATDRQPIRDWQYQRFNESTVFDETYPEFGWMRAFIEDFGSGFRCEVHEWHFGPGEPRYRVTSIIAPRLGLSGGSNDVA